VQEKEEVSEIERASEGGGEGREKKARREGVSERESLGEIEKERERERERRGH